MVSNFQIHDSTNQGTLVQIIALSCLICSPEGSQITYIMTSLGVIFLVDL